MIPSVHWPGMVCFRKQLNDYALYHIMLLFIMHYGKKYVPLWKTKNPTRNDKPRSRTAKPHLIVSVEMKNAYFSNGLLISVRYKLHRYIINNIYSCSILAASVFIGNNNVIIIL